MDTDDLLEETYRAIIYEAECFDHCLTLHFGALASSCKNEHDYIKKAIELIGDMKKCDYDDLECIFFGDPPSLKEFQSALTKISTNIAKLQKGE